MANNVAQTNTIIPQRADLSESEVPNPLNPFFRKTTIDSDSNTVGAGLYEVDTSGGAVTLTLDTEDAKDAKQIVIKRNGGSDVTVDTEDDATIDGSSSKTISSDDSALWLIHDVDNDNWDIVARIATASTTVSGFVELATSSETTTGTDSTRAITPSGLASSDYGIRVIEREIVDADTNVSTGDGLNGNFIRIPKELDGYNLVDAEALHATAGSGSLKTKIQIRNVTDSVDMLSQKLSIDSGEKDSSTAATDESIDTSNDDVATGDHLRVDLDEVPATKPSGLVVTLSFKNN